MILMKKYFFSLTLLLALVFFMGGCGDDTPTISGVNEINVTVGSVLPDLLEGINLQGVTSEDLDIDYSNVDLDTVGSYTVTYSLDIEGTDAITYEIIVNVVGYPLTKEPLIFGIKDITYVIGDSIPNLLDGVTASDMEYGDLTFRIEFDSSSVDYEVEGIYEIYYYVENIDGYNYYESAELNVVLDDLDVDIPDEFAVVIYDGLYGLVDLDNNLVIPFEYSLIQYYGSGMFMLEKYVSEPLDAVPYRIDFSENIFYFDSSTNEFYQYSYRPLESFVNGITRVRNEYYLQALMDTEGNIITPFIYDSLFILENDRVIVSVGNNYGIIDYEGNEITDIKYDYITTFFGDNFVKRLGSYYEVVTEDNESVFEVSSTSFYEFIMEDESSVYRVEVDGNKILIDESFNILLETNDYWLGMIKNGLFTSITDDKFTLYNLYTDTVIEDIISYQTYDDFIIFENKGGFGLFDIETDSIIINPIYSNLTPLIENDDLLVATNVEGLKGIISKSNVEYFAFEAMDITKDTDEDFYRYTDIDGYYGLINLDGQSMTYRTFLSIGEYVDGYALVIDQDTELYSYLYESGLLTSPPALFDAYPFENGFAIVKRIDSEDGWTAMGTDLQYVSIDTYYEVYDFVDGVAKVRLSDVEETPAYSYIDKDGLITEDVFYRGYDMYNGHAIVQFTSSYLSMGSINVDGDVVVPGIYRGVGFANDGMIRVSNYSYQEGFYNYAGVLAVPIGYDYNINFNSGRVIASIGNTYAIFDQDGNVTLDFQSNYIYDFSDGYAKFIDSMTGKRGFYDTSGNVAIRATLENVSSFSGGVAIIQSSETYLYSFINTDGDLVTDYKFNEITPFTNESPYTVVRIGSYEGLIDKYGNMVLDAKYSIETTDSGYIVSKVGYDPIYMELDNTTLKYSVFNGEGVEYLVEYNDGWSLINSGNTVIDEEFDYVEYDFEYDSWIIGNDGLYGLYDSEFNIILEIMYNAFYFSTSNSDIYVWYLGNTGVMSETGETIVEPIYDDIDYLEAFDLYLVSIGDIQGLYNAEGEILLPNEYYIIDVTLK